MSVSIIDIETKKIIHWELFSIKASTMELSCMKLIQKLTELYEKFKENELIILHEDQPRCNKKTVQIAGQIQMYFCLKKLENKQVKKIEGIHPRHKITYYVKKPEDEELPLERFKKIKKGHYKNKQILIEHAKRILIHNVCYIEQSFWSQHNRTKESHLCFQVLWRYAHPVRKSLRYYVVVSLLRHKVILSRKKNIFTIHKGGKLWENCV